MNVRTSCVLTVALGMLASGAQAQFIGDALAAAGVAATEQQAAPAIGSLRGASAPPVGSTVQSGAPQSAKVYEPTDVGKDVGIQREQSTSTGESSGNLSVTKSSSSSGTGSVSIQQTQVGGSSGFAGAKLQAATLDPNELASWQAAMNPVGAKVASLPSTAIPITIGGKSYQYDKGVFYEKKGGAHVAVPAPVGAVIPSKPPGAATVFAGGKPYIYYFGTFYVYDGGQRAYVVVAPPAGALVDYLPDSAKKVEWNGATHYSYAGTYYIPYYRGSKLVFEVAAGV